MPNFAKNEAYGVLVNDRLKNFVDFPGENHNHQSGWDAGIRAPSVQNL